MRIKLADYPNWKQVEEKEYINQYFNNEEFKGNVSLLKVIKVKDETWIEIPSGFICAKYGDKVYVK